MEELTKRFILAYEWLKANELVKNDTDFATKLDVSRSSVTEILKGRSNPGGKPLQNIVNNFPVDGNWLLTGKGQIDAEVNAFNAAKTSNKPYKNDDTPDATDVMHVVSDTELARYAPPTKGKNAPPSAPASQVLVPQIIVVDSRSGDENILHVNAKAAAGYLLGYADKEYIERLPSFRLPGLTGGTFRSFEVVGDSMHPTLKNQQMVIGRWVERLADIKDDRVYIVVHKTRGIVIKRLLNHIERRGVIVAKSDATDDRELYRNYDIYPDDIQEIWYGVFNGSFDFSAPSDMWKRLNEVEVNLRLVMQSLHSNNILPK